MTVRAPLVVWVIVYDWGRGVQGYAPGKPCARNSGGGHIDKLGDPAKKTSLFYLLFFRYNDA
jgi:hypothetical protein